MQKPHEASADEETELKATSHSRDPEPEGKSTYKEPMLIEPMKDLEQSDSYQKYSELNHPNTESDRKYLELNNPNTESDQKYVELNHPNTESDRKFSELNSPNTESEQKYSELNHSNTESDQKYSELNRPNTELEENPSTKLEEIPKMADSDRSSNNVQEHHTSEEEPVRTATSDCKELLKVDEKQVCNTISGLFEQSVESVPGATINFANCFPTRELDSWQQVGSEIFLFLQLNYIQNNLSKFDTLVKGATNESICSPLK